MVGEDGGAFPALRRRAHHLGQAVAVEDVVAEDQRAGLVADEIRPDHEGLGEPVRRGLLGVGQLQAPLRAVAEEVAEHRQVARGGDDQDLADAGQHERRQRVEDHRLVVDRQHLLRHDMRHGMEPRAASARQDDAAHVDLPQNSSEIEME